MLTIFVVGVLWESYNIDMFIKEWIQNAIPYCYGVAALIKRKVGSIDVTQKYTMLVFSF